MPGAPSGFRRSSHNRSHRCRSRHSSSRSITSSNRSRGLVVAGTAAGLPVLQGRGRVGRGRGRGAGERGDRASGGGQRNLLSCERSCQRWAKTVG